MALTATVAGCASVQLDTGGGPTGARPTSSAVTPTSAEPTPAPVRTTTTFARCGARSWAFGFTPVQPASGNRFLSVQLRNCSDRSRSVPDTPAIVVRDAAGKTVAVQWDWRDPKIARDVDPGHDIYLRLHWLSSGRCDRGATSLEMAIGDSTARLTDCLQLGGLSGVTGEPAAADATWAGAP
ncbi:hypothetical protein [Flexivirga sp. B27]